MPLTAAKSMIGINSILPIILGQYIGRTFFRRLFLHILQDLGLHIAAHMDYTVQRAKAALTIEETANK